MRFLIRRAARTALILLLISVGSFALIGLMPGDYYTELMLDSKAPSATLAALRAEHGLDRAFPERFAAWTASAVRGDWGLSLFYNVRVGPLVWARARNTLVLTVAAAIVAWLFAVPAGVWIAANGRAPVRALSGWSLALLLATPEVLVVLALQFLAVRSGRLPAGGMTSLAAGPNGWWEVAEDLARHLALPVAALALSLLPALVMHTASAVSEALAAPFIRAARMHGIPRLRLLYRHALPAAAHPLISLLGLSLGALLSGSVLVENAMSWPGLGTLMLQAALQRDINLVAATLMLSAAFLLAGNLVSDVLLYAVDPRIRRG